VFFLASNSPRRKQLLYLTGWSFEIVPAEVDESQQPGEQPRDYVLRMAREKALAVIPRISPGNLIVAADTSVVDRNQVLGKPGSPTQAVAMLQRLRGRSHQVFTGLAVYSSKENQLRLDCCVTQVIMRDYSQEEILEYVASGDPFDKAGAYAIQHRDFNPVQRLDGCYANVVGLPVCHLASLLNQFGEFPAGNAPGACTDKEHYRCTIRHLVSS
jgi:septum formation protein